MVLIILGGIAGAGGWWWYQRQMEQLPEGIVKVNGRFELRPVWMWPPFTLDALKPCRVIEGQEIAAGELVAKLSSEEAAARLKAARAARERAIQAVARAQAETAARNRAGSAWRKWN